MNLCLSYPHSNAKSSLCYFFNVAGWRVTKRVTHLLLRRSVTHPWGVPGAIHSIAARSRVRATLARRPGVWLIILAELLTFGIFFVSYAFARSRDVAGFNAAQATLTCIPARSTPCC